MLNSSSPDICEKVTNGEYFSLFRDKSNSYWVISNEFPSIFHGPYPYELANEIMTRSNEYFNSILK